MRTHNKSNALLVELLIVIMFFMLSATILLRVFAASRIQSDRADAISDALRQAQNVAERLYAADSAPDALEGMQFTQDGEKWILDKGAYRLEVTIADEGTRAGSLSNQTVRALSGDETLFTLPVSRYVEAQP